MHNSSLKSKWDNKNVFDYAVKEAELEGKLEGKLEKAKEIARDLKKEGMHLAQIEKFTRLSIEEIEKL